MSSERLTQALTPDTPFLCEIQEREKGLSMVLIASYDLPSIFSLLTGILSSLGMEITSGQIRTVPSAAGGARREGAGPARVIIDRFAGRLPEGVSPSLFGSDLERRLGEIIPPLLAGTGLEAAAAARRRVNEWVAAAVTRHSDSTGETVLLPVRLSMDLQDPDFTWVELTAQDTSFFLYSIATAITLQGLSVERVEISTHQGMIRDRFALLDHQGRKISSPRVLNRLSFSILLTKQFTFFLGEAPDPYAAIVRFESLLEELAESQDMEQWQDLLQNPGTLRELAKLLGMSDYLWEEFIRLQYENILPLLGATPLSESGTGSRASREDFEYRLQVELSKCEEYEEQKRCLNRFKDSELYKLDLNQIINQNEDFLSFSRSLTLLAEAVVATAFALAEKQLRERYGLPRTVAGIEVPWAVLGLGKLGGQALGYASDIELLCVYSDNGSSDGARSVPNSEYFERLTREATGMISAKQEGIFHIDLRLRPHGNAGPQASSLERFSAYYRGEAHSFERLALVRLRSFAGDPLLGRRIEALRDEIVYAADSLNLEELRSLRQRQLSEKSRPGSINAKFSTGALVDLEYSVQILQVEHGRNYPSLRTPSIQQALEELSRRGIIRGDEAQELIWAYRFLRRLINALRMLRGSAKDLYLPDLESHEYSHLARRMGYRPARGLSPREQLYTEFEQRTARIRGFVERYLGRESLPSDGAGSIVDLILFPEAGKERRETILSRYGFRNPARGVHNLESLAAASGRRETFASVAVLAVHELMRQSDPDMALNNWERFSRAAGPSGMPLEEMLSQPTRITLLMQLFSGSQYLSDTLIAEPGLFGGITDPSLINRPLKREEFRDRLKMEPGGRSDAAAVTAALRHAKKRELLRIGTRDICYGAPLEEICGELSLCAEAQIEAALAFAWEESGGSGEPPLVIGAFGKLGGAELNYSSDLDLIGIARKGELDPETGRQLLERMRALLADPAPAGAGYRIDFRLRPFGRAGRLTTELASLEEYYRKRASLWELQALLKLRLLNPGEEDSLEFAERIEPLLRVPRDPAAIVASVRKNRESAIHQNREIRKGMREIKNGPGGIRDIEFLLQALQLIHAPDSPELISGSTLRALELLGKAEIISVMDQRSLNEAYRLLRRAEHFLQLYEDRQVHTLPREPEKLEILGRRSAGVSGTEFLGRIESIATQVQRISAEYLDRYL